MRLIILLTFYFGCMLFPLISLYDSLSAANKANENDVPDARIVSQSGKKNKCHCEDMDSTDSSLFVLDIQLTAEG